MLRGGAVGCADGRKRAVGEGGKRPGWIFIGQAGVCERATGEVAGMWLGCGRVYGGHGGGTTNRGMAWWARSHDGEGVLLVVLGHVGWRYRVVAVQKQVPGAHRSGHRPGTGVDVGVFVHGCRWNAYV